MVCGGGHIGDTPVVGGGDIAAPMLCWGHIWGGGGRIHWGPHIEGHPPPHSKVPWEHVGPHEAVGGVGVAVGGGL